MIIILGRLTTVDELKSRLLFSDIVSTELFIAVLLMCFTTGILVIQQF